MHSKAGKEWRRKEESGQAGLLVEDLGGRALKRMGVSSCPVEREEGGRLDPGLLSAALPSVLPLPAVASEFAGSPVKAWSLESRPCICQESLNLQHARCHPVWLYVIIANIFLRFLCAEHYLF